jgi:hypothetical protein
LVDSPDTRLEIRDANQNKLGFLHHNVTKSAINLRDRLLLLDSTSKELGKTQEIDILNEAVLIKSDEGNEIGEVKRDKKLLGDSWGCRFVGNLDRRILIFLPAFLSVLQDEKKEKLKQLEKEEKK